MAGLHCSEDEAREINEYDKRVEHEKNLEYDLTPEQNKVAQKMTRTGTRKPTVYNFNKPRERKPNATKAGIIAEIASFLTEKSEFSVENLEIANKERQIAFKIGEDMFEITLVQKRKPKK